MAALALALLVASGAAHGQGTPDRFRGRQPGRAPGPARETELVVVGTNAALGGLTAGLLQRLRGGSFWAAFGAGTLGGAVAYAGKRIAVERFDGAGLLGREVAAVGSSIVRNASDGRAALEQLVLPVGFVRLYLRGDTTSARRLRARLKLDVPTLIATGYVGLQPNVDFDLAASISAGMPVFVSPGRTSESGWAGAQAAGVIWLRGDTPAARESETPAATVFAHERVHALQYDFSFLVWSDPVEGWLTHRLPGGVWIDDHLDLGLHLAGWSLANQLIDYPERPWEYEAHFLDGTRWERE